MSQQLPKKILLINPPIEDFYQTKIRQEPLGLAYLAAILRQAGFKVIWIDALAVPTRRTIQIPKSLHYLKPFYPVQDLSPFRLFSNYFHFGKSWQELENEIAATKPDLIGITANFTPYFSMAKKVAGICKRIFPEIPIAVGGHHATASPQSALAADFDWVVLGEGEMTFLQLARTFFSGELEILQNLPGIAFRKDGFVQINPPADRIENLDELPFPKAAQNLSRKMVLTSRGCPRNCDFCTIRKVMGRKIRMRSIEAVLEEIAYWRQQGFREIDFEDDNLLFYPERAEMLFKEIIQRFGKRQLRFSAMNGVSAEKLNVNLMKLMARAGFEWLNLPLVSGNQKIQQQIHRNQSREHFLEIVRQAPDFDLKIVGYLILGLPEDTLENMIFDILTLAQERILIGPSVFYPPPGSPVFDECVARKYIQPDTFLKFRSTAFSVETPNFTRTELVTLFRIVRLINYLKELIDFGNFQNESVRDWFFRQPAPQLRNKNRLEKEKIAFILLREFFLNKRLNGLKLTGKFGNQFNYEMIEYKVSNELIARIWQQLAGLKIKGVVSNFETRI